MVSLHRLLLAVVLALNAIAFAGVDPITRLFTAILVIALAYDMRRLPTVPRMHRWAGFLLLALVILQLTPMPTGIRRLLAPGFGEVLQPGWSPLSLAPWSTAQTAASAIVAIVLALIAARMATTRSGLPALVAIIASVGGLVAILGLASEGGEAVLRMRETGIGGGGYGPFVNRNHFAHCMELTVPAFLVLLAASGRRLERRGFNKERSAVFSLAAAVGLMVCCAALIRCASRGGIIFLVVGVLVSTPWWLRPWKSRRWPWILVCLVVLSGTGIFAATRYPVVEQRFLELFVIEGAEANSRLDMWEGSVELWKRAPLLGTGMGTYRHVIGLDKPPTGASVLEHAHNDWAEWSATAGWLGVALLVLAGAGLAGPLSLNRVRRLRFEYRYPLAGFVAVLAASALHEGVGFGLQTPLNRYVFAVWIGLFWGVITKTSSRHETKKARTKDGAEDSASSS